MWVLKILHYRDIIELDVEILIHGFQGPPDLDVVLELDSDFMVDQRLEEAIRKGETLARERHKRFGVCSECTNLKKSILVVEMLCRPKELRCSSLM